MKIKIYTRIGDKGKTSLFGGVKKYKNDIRINAYGTIDELNSIIGVLKVNLKDKQIGKFISEIQNDLFLIGSHLAGSDVKLDGLIDRVEEMEKIIDELNGKMPELRNFILPEGCLKSCLSYYVRAVARRAEREVVTLSRKNKVEDSILIYMNRLSDLLFIFGRYFNYIEGIKEAVWDIKKNPLI